MQHSLSWRNWHLDLGPGLQLGLVLLGAALCVAKFDVSLDLPKQMKFEISTTNGVAPRQRETNASSRLASSPVWRNVQVVWINSVLKIVAVESKNLKLK